MIILSRFLLSSRTFSKIFFAVCADPSRIGNGFCDDATNNEVCEWDGGDCCGDNVNTDYCIACECDIEAHSKCNYGNFVIAFIV